MTDEQIKPWTHSRDVVIKFPSSNPKIEPELVVAFRVEPEKRVEFGKLFEEYLNFCYRSKAIVRIKDEITDAESGEPCSIIFEINGERPIVGAEMQRIGASLMQHSARIR